MTAPQSPATIQPIDKASPEAQSANLVEGNLAQLKALFPEAFTEGRVDFEVLKQLLGAAVDEREEKYGLNWHLWTSPREFSAECLRTAILNEAACGSKVARPLAEKDLLPG